MKFTANSVELQRTLSKLGGVIPTKSTMPILENMLFDLAGDVLTVTATDLAISLTVTLRVKGGEDGKIVVPAKRLVDTIRSLPDTSAAFNIDTTSNRILITTDNGEYSLTGEGAKEFPVVPPFTVTSEIAIGNDVLKRIIHRTAFAVSTDELRPAMMGVLLQAKGKELHSVSTDGHRLVKLINKMGKAVTLKKDVIVPAKALNIVGRSLDAGDCTISVSDTHVKFTFDTSVLISRLIDETYPNYESVIPTDNTKVLTIHREQTIASIRRVALYASATTHQIKFDIGSQVLNVSAQDVDFGGAAKESLVCAFSGEKLEIGFNSGYVIDILTHLESEQVTFNFSTPTRAGIVAPVGSTEQEEVMMLVMPVRLNN